MGAIAGLCVGTVLGGCGSVPAAPPPTDRPAQPLPCSICHAHHGPDRRAAQGTDDHYWFPNRPDWLYGQTRIPDFMILVDR
jgi:hypothetical protein